MPRTPLTVLIVACTLLAGPSFAAEASCAAQAADRKLHGAAKASFVKKCEKDAGLAAPGAACTAKASERKLAGAAKTSFVKKCEKDAAARP